MSEKIKNKKNLIIGIGIIALVAIVIGVATLIKGNNDISGAEKKVSFGNVFGTREGVISSITYDAEKSKESKNYFYNIKYFSKSKDAICHMNYQVDYRRPMEFELPDDKIRDYYYEPFVARFAGNITELNTQISFPKKNKYNAPVESVRIYLYYCNGSEGEYIMHELSPSYENDGLTAPTLKVSKNDKLYNTETAAFNIDATAKTGVFKVSYYLDEEKIDESIIYANNTKVNLQYEVKRTTEPKVLTIIAEDNNGNIELENALIPALNHTGPYCFTSKANRNITLNLGESKNIEMYCLNEIGVEIKGKEKPQLNYGNNILVSVPDSFYSEYDIDADVVIDNKLPGGKTWLLKVTGENPGKSKVELVNGSKEYTGVPIDTKYNNEEKDFINVEVLNTIDRQRPKCSIWSYGDTDAKYDGYVGSDFEFFIHCTDDVKFNKENISEVLAKNIIVNNEGTQIIPKLVKVNDSDMPREVIYTFSVVPTKIGKLTYYANEGFIKDATGKENEKSYEYTFNIGKMPGEKPVCKVSTDKNEITVGESVNATVTCTTKEKFDKEGIYNSYNESLPYTANLGADISLESAVYGTQKFTAKLKITFNKAGMGIFKVNSGAVFDEDGLNNNEEIAEIKVKERIKDTTAPVCKFTSESSKVRTGKTTKVYLTCDDASGFKNTNLSVNNFGVNKIFGISLLRIENVKLIKQTSTSSTWEIGVKGRGLGKAKLYLNENAVSDKFDNKNAKTYATTPIKVTLF